MLTDIKLGKTIWLNGGVYDGNALNYFNLINWNYSISCMKNFKIICTLLNVNYSGSLNDFENMFLNIDNDVLVVKTAIAIFILSKMDLSNIEFEL